MTLEEAVLQTLHPPEAAPSSSQSPEPPTHLPCRRQGRLLRGPSGKGPQSETLPAHKDSCERKAHLSLRRSKDTLGVTEQI